MKSEKKNMQSTDKIGHYLSCDISIINQGLELQQELASKGITKILISESTNREIEDTFVTRAIDRLAVKGRAQAIQIFEVLGEKGYRLSKAEQCFCKGLKLYRQGEFKKAALLFEQGAKNDRPCRAYLSRCRRFIKHPPPPDWDGVWIARTK
jgi:adenylate cyclase